MAEAKSKIKKKMYVKILAPKLFNNVVIGETYVETPNVLVGRKIKANLMTLTGNPRSQSVQIRLDITGVQGGDSVTTEAFSYMILPSFMRRLVRKGKGRIDAAYTLATKDGKLVRVCPYILTVYKTSKSVHTDLRNRIHSLLIKHLAKNDYEVVMQDILAGKLQNAIKADLSKIHPIRQFDIRAFRIVGTGTAPEIAEDEPVASPEVPADEEDSEKPKKSRKKKAPQEEEMEAEAKAAAEAGLEQQSDDEDDDN